MGCACLSSMYLTLSQLQSMSNFAFPFALQPVRQAIATADSVLECQHCPTDANSAMLNVTILISLLFTVAQRCRLIVEEINSETERAERGGQIKRFHFGDANGENMHLHTAMPDCPARFDLELEAPEWSVFAKRVMKRDVYGTAEDHWKSLSGIILRLQQRQRAWHQDPEKDALREHMFGKACFDHMKQVQAHTRSDWQCVKQASAIQVVVDNIPW
jgi:hypothetical protein